MNLKLLEEVTNQNGKGKPIKDFPESFHNDFKNLKKEFNELINSLEFIELCNENTDERWQNSGYFKPYFWSKIFFKDSKYKYKDCCLWLSLEDSNLCVYFGTSDEFKGERQNIIDFVRKKINNKVFNNFELSEKLSSVIYTFTGNIDNINKKDIVNIIDYLKPIYKEVLDVFIFNNISTDKINYSANDQIQTKNIILYGAPGVGKTHNYKKLISMIEKGEDEKNIFKTIIENKPANEDINYINAERIEFVCFHQSYSYEDFIEGLRPNEDGKIKPQDGIFKSFCNKAEENDKNFYMVIDEINRGNISKIFGELITLIEESKRDDYEVTLPYSKTKFKVPSNLYIIATMNSTDKSIATVDIALRRRFTFLRMLPNLELVSDEGAREFMRQCNKYIKDKLGEDYMLGHSYFMGDNVDLDFIIEYKIKPLLEEYFYAEDKSVDEVLQEIGKR